MSREIGGLLDLDRHGDSARTISNATLTHLPEGGVTALDGEVPPFELFPGDTADRDASRQRCVTDRVLHRLCPVDV